MTWRGKQVKYTNQLPSPVIPTRHPVLRHGVGIQSQKQSSRNESELGFVRYVGFLFYWIPAISVGWISNAHPPDLLRRMADALRLSTLQIFPIACPYG